MPPVAKKGRADRLIKASTSTEVNEGRADSIKATVPLTIGAEKLVPTEAVLPV